ncbi:hypothetical protein JCGZ_16796 [Jatropha curcas]|uniref:Uncharacterized protein n=1 Tax=Jatropha curcas TaxID=180498 RepID=A0A067LH34_JATCU|nr:hypothetical protein JCGZ_16796 [Jatropha curcas]
MVNPICGNLCLMNPYWVHTSQVVCANPKCWHPQCINQQKIDVLQQPDFVSQGENSQDPPSRTIRDPKPENVPQKRNDQERKSEEGSSKNDNIKHQNGSTVRPLVPKLPRRRTVIFDRVAPFGRQLSNYLPRPGRYGVLIYWGLALFVLLMAFMIYGYFTGNFHFEFEME